MFRAAITTSALPAVSSTQSQKTRAESAMKDPSRRRSNGDRKLRRGFAPLYTRAPAVADECLDRAFFTGGERELETLLAVIQPIQLRFGTAAIFDINHRVDIGRPGRIWLSRPLVVPC